MLAVVGNAFGIGFAAPDEEKKMDHIELSEVMETKGNQDLLECFLAFHGMEEFALD